MTASLGRGFLGVTKLNGWYRLWILVSLTLFIPSTGIVVLLLPGPMTIPHHASFYESLSTPAKAQLAPETDTDASKVEMPNGHVIKVRTGIELKKSTLVLAEYVSQLDRLLLRKRFEFGLMVVGVWLTGCASLLSVGIGIAWVRDGFSSAKNVP